MITIEMMMMRMTIVEIMVCFTECNILWLREKKRQFIKLKFHILPNLDGINFCQNEFCRRLKRTQSLPSEQNMEEI